MPLKFTDHSKPPQLEEELRNLYRQVDKLTAGSGTAIILPGGGNGGNGGNGGDDHDHGGQVGTVFSWHLRAEFYFTPSDVPPNGTEYVFDLPVPQIRKPYTHLELDITVLQAIGLSVAFDWVIRGNAPYYFWDRPEEGYPHTPEDPGPGAWHLESPYATHYAANFVPFAKGHYRIQPVFNAAEPPEGDLAFAPIFPARLVGDASEWEELKAVATIGVGEGHLGGVCYKVWLVGRYVLREDDEPDERVCYFAT